MADPQEQQYPEGLAQMAAIVEATLVDGGVDLVDAHVLARAVTDRIRRGLGGTYIPRGTSLDVERIRRDVAQRWNGENTRELCREHDISERRLRQLVDEWRSRGQRELI